MHDDNWSHTQPVSGDEIVSMCLVDNDEIVSMCLVDNDLVDCQLAYAAG
jgi:hypothetical protein